MAQSRHIIKVEQSRERILFGVCLRVSQLLNTCSVPKDAVFLQENDNSFPLANMVGVEFWCQVPHNTGINPKDLKKARHLLEFTQIQAGVALGGVRPETISRWENTPRNERPKVRGIHVETTILFIQIADLLVDLYPDKENRMTFLHSSRGELGGQSPHKVILEDPPNGLLLVYRLLGRMAEGIPT